LALKFDQTFIKTYQLSIIEVVLKYILIVKFQKKESRWPNKIQNELPPPGIHTGPVSKFDPPPPLPQFALPKFTHA